MSVPLKSPADLEAMRPAGRAVWRILDVLLDAVRPGLTTADLDTLARSHIQDLGARSLFLNYRQGRSPLFPACICVSLNEEAAHGVPGPRILRHGDLLSMDLGLSIGGWCADAARSAVVGGARRLRLRRGRLPRRLRRR